MKIDLNIANDDGMTAFLIACQNGHSDVVKIFMENAAALSINLNAKSNNGVTAFHIACHWGYSDIVEVFVKNADTLSIELTGVPENLSADFINTGSNN